MERNALGGVRARGRVEVCVGDDVAQADNLVVSGGLTRIAQVLAGTASNTTTSWYIELGTGTTAVSASQTTLATPSTATWLQVTAVSASGSTTLLEAVYNAASANGTWTELGLFANATATAGSGTMVARVLLPWTKTSSQYATVTWSVTFSAT